MQTNDCSGRMQLCTASDPINDARSGLKCTRPQAFTFIWCTCCCALHATMQPPTGTNKMRGHERITRTHIAARQPTTPHHRRHLRPKNLRCPRPPASPGCGACDQRCIIASCSRSPKHFFICWGSLERATSSDWGKVPGKPGTVVFNCFPVSFDWILGGEQ